MPPLGPLRSPHIAAHACGCGLSGARQGSVDCSLCIHIDPSDGERRLLGSTRFPRTVGLQTVQERKRLTFGFARPMLAEATKLLNTNEATD